MFELVSYEIHEQGDKFIIQIFILNPTNESHDVKIVFKDSIFHQCTKIRTMNFSPNMTHWVSWDLTQNNPSEETNGIQMRALWGANLAILVNEEVINEYELKYVLTDLNIRRGLNKFSPFNKKKFWIIGDSHPGYYTNTSTENLTLSSYDIVPLGMLSLTLNNFLRSDWRRWLSTLPIFDDDIIAFDIGEIDIRGTLFETSIKKDIELYSLTDDLLTRYFEFLSYFKQNYKNEIIVLSINRPIKNGCLSGNAEYYKLNISTPQQRVELWNYYDNKLKLFCNDNSIKYWDIKHMYKDKDGTLFNDVLYYNDIHIKVKEPMLFDLRHKIENNF